MQSATRKQRMVAFLVVWTFLCTIWRSSYGTMDIAESSSRRTTATDLAATMLVSVGIIGSIVAIVLGDKDSKSHTQKSETQGTITATDVFFTEPGTKSLVLQNSADGVSSVTSIAVDNDTNVVLGDTSDCRSIAAGGSCSVNLTTTQNSYGRSIVTITYNGLKTTTATVTIEPITLQLYKASEDNALDIKQTSSEIILPITTHDSPDNSTCPWVEPYTYKTVTYYYKNISKFNWQKPSISWQTMFDSPCNTDTQDESYVAISNNSCASRSTVAPGDSCRFSLKVKYNHPGDWGIIKTTGSNISNTQLLNVLAGGGLSIAINTDAKAYHLGYRSVKITNTITPTTGQTYGNMYITGITAETNLASAKNNSSLLKYCAPDAADCDYKTDCNIDVTGASISLYPNGSSAGTNSCLVWFKANSKDDQGEDLALQSATGTIKVTVNGNKVTQEKKITPFSDYEKDCAFTVSYNKSLYAGANKHDGTSWSQVGTDTPMRVYSFVTVKSDLYAGGDFNNSGSNNIAKWDGANWSSLGSGLNGAVHALTSIDSELYAGGVFTGTSDNTVTGLKSIAKWDGSKWLSLGSGLNGEVYALTSIGSELYVGGDFTGTSGGVVTELKSIAKWDSLKWSSLGSGLNGKVYALTSIGYELYAGGYFTGTSDSTVTEFNNIVKWEGLKWSSLGSGLNNKVLVLASIGTQLYAGGDFTAINGGDTVLQHMAKWDTNNPNWSALGSGLEESVHSLTNNGSDIYAKEASNCIKYWHNNDWATLEADCPSSVLQNKALIIAPSLMITDYSP